MHWDNFTVTLSSFHSTHLLVTPWPCLLLCTTTTTTPVSSLPLWSLPTKYISHSGITKSLELLQNEGTNVLSNADNKTQRDLFTLPGSFIVQPYWMYKNTNTKHMICTALHYHLIRISYYTDQKYDKGRTLLNNMCNAHKLSVKIFLYRTESVTLEISFNESLNTFVLWLKVLMIHRRALHYTVLYGIRSFW